MIDPGLYLTFILASIVLILIPGPNVALIVANSVARGPRAGLLTVAGTSAAFVVQVTLTVLGLTAVLTELSVWFEWIRWIGVAYLLFLGVRQWRAPPVDLSLVEPQRDSAHGIALRGFLVCITNPKTLLFCGAFFPQFIDPHRPIGPQVMLLGITSVAVGAVLDSSWALAAGRVRHLLAARPRLRNRLTGGCLIGAGVGLALAHRR
jgi:threonine/homoserine/homoserine lactone efflux protein